MTNLYYQKTVKTFLAFFIIQAAMGCFSYTYSQPAYNDAQLWFKGDMEMALSKHFNPRFAFESRLAENFSHFNYFYFDVGGSYKINSDMKLVLDYILVEYGQPQGYFSTRHQYNISWYYRYKTGHFIFVNRILQEAQLKDFNSSDRGRYLQDFYLRDKFTIRYKVNKHLLPYISDEVYYRMDHGPMNGINRNRVYFGILWAVKKASQVEIFYLIENNFNVSVPKNSYVIGLGYNLNLF